MTEERVVLVKFSGYYAKYAALHSRVVMVKFSGYYTKYAALHSTVDWNLWSVDGTKYRLGRVGSAPQPGDLVVLRRNGRLHRWWTKGDWRVVE